MLPTLTTKARKVLLILLLLLLTRSLYLKVCKYQPFLLYITDHTNKHNTEAAARRCSVKKVFLQISQNSQRNTCARASFLIKLLVSDLQLIKKETLAQLFTCRTLLMVACDNSILSSRWYKEPFVLVFDPLMSGIL